MAYCYQVRDLAFSKVMPNTIMVMQGFLVPAGSASSSSGLEVLGGQGGLAAHPAAHHLLQRLSRPLLSTSDQRTGTRVPPSSLAAEH